MKYYLIVSDHCKMYRGYTTSKKILKKFIKQRGAKGYTIHKFKAKEISDAGKDYLDFTSELDCAYGDVLTFRDEDEFFIESLTTFEQELSMFIYDLIDNVEYLRLTKTEKDIIVKGLGDIYKTSKLLYEGESDFNEILNIPRMMQEII